MKEVFLNQGYLILISSIIVPIITSLISYFAAIKKTQRNFEIETKRIEEETKRELLRAEKERENEIERIKAQTEQEVKLLDEKLKFSVIENLMKNPKGLPELLEIAENMNNQFTKNNHPSARKKGRK